jgi:hypothetical protein
MFLQQSADPCHGRVAALSPFWISIMRTATTSRLVWTASLFQWRPSARPSLMRQRYCYKHSCSYSYVDVVLVGNGC